MSRDGSNYIPGFCPLVGPRATGNCGTAEHVGGFSICRANK